MKTGATIQLTQLRIHCAVYAPVQLQNAASCPSRGHWHSCNLPSQHCSAALFWLVRIIPVQSRLLTPCLQPCFLYCNGALQRARVLHTATRRCTPDSLQQLIHTARCFFRMSAVTTYVFTTENNATAPFEPTPAPTPALARPLETLGSFAPFESRPENAPLTDPDSRCSAKCRADSCGWCVG